MRPDKIVFLGKGGIGKSTLSANLSALYARSGLRVLHVGCDPKGDSTALLVERSAWRPVLAMKGPELGVAPPSAFVVRSRLGVDCVEAGGPEPGIGCAGRGISKMIEVFDRERLISRGRYEVVLFDVLGDVVCGGFAAPMRQGFGEKVVIVVSEEGMSLYAANNVARAVRNYAPNGVGLCGLLANVRDPGADVGAISRFARRIGTSVLAVVRRDPSFRKGETLSRCLVEVAPRSKPLAELARLGRRLRELDPRRLPVPDPMGEEEFFEASRRQFEFKPARGGKAPAAPPPPEEAAASAADAPEPLVAAAPGAPAAEPAAPPAGPEAAAGTPGPAGEPEEAPPHARWTMWAWGVEDQWRQFFAEPELALNSGKPLLRDAAYVLHKELECFFVEARTDDGSASFFNHPWPDHCSAGLPLLFELRARGCRHVVADIKDCEIVFGGSRRLEAALARLRKDPGKTRLAVFLYSCPTVITGDDLGPVIGRFREGSGIPVIFPDRDADQPTDVMRGLFETVGRGEGFAKRAGRGRGVNLVGFPRDRALGELEALLGEAGIAVNSRLLPEYDLDDVRRYPAAALSVLKPHAAYEDFYGRVLARLPVPAATIEGPYGVEGTRRWLEAVAARVGRARALERAWAARFAALRGRWEALGREASARTLGIVADSERLRRLRDCRHSSGVPLLPVLRELGFRLEWLLWCPCGGSGEHAAGAGGAREAVRRFHGPGELSGLLREEPLDAVYSDIFFDTRLSRAGKAQFSLPFFEPGLEGALRTAERLLGACRLPLYRRYARYLQGGVHGG